MLIVSTRNHWNVTLFIISRSAIKVLKSHIGLPKSAVFIISVNLNWSRGSFHQRYFQIPLDYVVQFLVHL